MNAVPVVLYMHTISYCNGTVTVLWAMTCEALLFLGQNALNVNL